MKIHLNKGIDKLRFGMTRPEVERVFGKPNRELIDSDDENELIWEYSDEKLRLTFYQNEADRLGYIRCSNSSLTINDFEIIDKKIEDVKNQIDSNFESWEKVCLDPGQGKFCKSLKTMALRKFKTNI